jgi:hypothetical protein
VLGFGAHELSKIVGLNCGAAATADSAHSCILIGQRSLHSLFYAKWDGIGERGFAGRGNAAPLRRSGRIERANQFSSGITLLPASDAGILP